MSLSLVFRIEQSSDEKRRFGVRFIKPELAEADYVIQSVDITAIDSNGDDVTNDVLDTGESDFEDNLAIFMTDNPAVGNYIIKCKAVMDDGSEPAAWGLLVVADPSLEE